MRKLVHLALGMFSGCAFGAYLFQSKLLLPLTIFFVIAIVLHICLKMQRAALLFLGLLFGIFYTAGYSRYYFDTAAPYDRTTQTVTITATAYSEKLDYGIRCEGEMTLSGKTYRVRFYGDRDMPIAPGDVVEGDFLLKTTTPGGSEDAAYHQGNGLYFLAYDSGDMTVTPGNGNSVRYFPQRLRKDILHRIEEIFPADTCGFAKALLLGDTDSLTYAQDTALQTSGIRHIVAVSGLHVSILFAIVFTLSGKTRYLTAILGLPTLALFAFTAGLTPSIIRACIMQSLMILALLLRREYDPPSALAFAVLVILGINPFAVLSVSFQLSCGCVAGIFLFSKRLLKYIYSKIRGFSVWHKALRTVGASLSVTVGTMIVTVPLCAVYFGSVSIAGLLTNLLTLWAVPVIFCGIVACCVLSVLFMPLAKLLAACISVLVRYVLLAAQWLSRLPFAAVYTQSPYILLWLVLCYGLFILFWLQGRKYPGRTAAVMASLLALSVGFSYIEPQLDDYRVTVLDVGQGQCMLLQSRGEAYLVDCGGSDWEETANIAAACLLSQGITHLDGVVITHYDDDHIGGLSCLLQRIGADMVYIPKGETAPPPGLPAEQKTTPIHALREMRLGSAKLTLIPGGGADKDNENSTCVLFQAAECAILITGDRAAEGEAMLLQQTELPKLDYLLAGHHGAPESTGLALLAYTRPDTVIISVGENRYGHPDRKLLTRLALFECRILRTDINGTILIRG